VLVCQALGCLASRPLHRHHTSLDSHMSCVSISDSLLPDSQLMQEEYTLKFGSYEGKTLLEVAHDFPSYLLWIGGMTTKYSLTKQAKELYAVICKDHPDDVQAVKEFLRERCRGCWEKLDSTQKHVCKAKNARYEGFYHFHPYGKRT
jgi:hypothetical protein